MTSPQDFSLSIFHKSVTDFTGLGLRTTGFSGRLDASALLRHRTEQILDNNLSHILQHLHNVDCKNAQNYKTIKQKTSRSVSLPPHSNFPIKFIVGIVVTMVTVRPHCSAPGGLHQFIVRARTIFI